MQNVPLVTLIFTCLSFFASLPAAYGQTSVSIGEGFECLTDIDGSRSIATLTNTGYTKVKMNAVTAKINKELRKLDGKDDRLEEIVQSKKSLVDKLLIKFIQLFVKSYPSADFTTEFDDKASRNAVVKSIRAYVKQHRSDLTDLEKRAKACKGGATSPPQNGGIITPTLKVVSFRGQRTAYAGFLILTPPRVPRFATKPGGFNVCTRIESSDPFTGGKLVTGVYTGVGTELCYIGSGIVDDDAVGTCNSTLPSGFVGLFLKKAQGDDLSDEGLKNLESLIVASPPTVFLLALDHFTGSRDEALARCETFKQ